MPRSGTATDEKARILGLQPEEQVNTRTCERPAGIPRAPALADSPVWRALTEPELIAQWLMPGSENFRLEVGHRYVMTTVPRPNTGFSGTVDVGSSRTSRSGC